MQVFRTCLLASFITTLFLSGCRFTSDSESVVINGDYPIAYVKRPKASLGSAIDSKLGIVGSDLFLRDLPSPDAQEINITRSLTNGAGMVADPDVSFDGTKIVFALKCTSSSSDRCKDDSTWNIWIYDHKQGTLERAIKDYQVANAADDLDPAFLPDGNIIFSSTRQKTTYEKNNFQYADEDSHNPASVLHTLNLASQTIEQISFNRSHDRNPSVLQNGRIIFSRWDHLGDRNQISIYTANPDGTDLDVYYGAHSPGDAFLHSKELPDGRLLATVMPLTGTWEGGALMVLDVKNFSDADAPAPGLLDKKAKGQVPASIQTIPIDDTVSRQGRYTTPFPLFDGSNQVLVGYSFFQAKSEQFTVASTNVEITEGVPSYGIYMLDLDDKSLRPIVLPPDDAVLTDPVALYPRQTIPPIIPRQITYSPGVFDPTNVEGIINVKSVYDTDKFGRMGQGVLTVDENVLTPIPLLKNDDPLKDTRQYLPDIARIKDPLQTSAEQRPARFVRVTTSIPTPPGLSQQVLGRTPFEMQRIVGYAPIEPDGSFKIKVPAETPLTISVLDKYGRAFENHTSWLQVRPGETLTCNGCHSPKRAPALNSEPIAGNHPNTALRDAQGQLAVPLPGETMAETRTRVDPSALQLSPDIVYQDVWADPTLQTPGNPSTIGYTGLNAVPVNGVINFPEHIQPILDAACTGCHNGLRSANNPTRLNLNGYEGGSGRYMSYENLLEGRPILDKQGLPVFEYEGDILTLKRTLPLVQPGYARGSYLIEVLFDEELFAEKSLPLKRRNHAAMLTDAQKRLIVEWIDVGAQYYNDPYDENGELRTLINRLDMTYFRNQLYSNFLIECATCHSPLTIGGESNPGFVSSGFVLMRNPESDYASVINMVGSTETPENSFILAIPSDASDGVHDKNQDTPSLPPAPYLPVGSDFYNDIYTWIQGAAP